MCLLCIYSMGCIYSRNMPYCMQCREACRDFGTACRTIQMVRAPNSYPGGREFKSLAWTLTRHSKDLWSTFFYTGDPDVIMSCRTCSCSLAHHWQTYLPGRPFGLCTVYHQAYMLRSGDFTCPCHGTPVVLLSAIQKSTSAVSWYLGDLCRESCRE